MFVQYVERLCCKHMVCVSECIGGEAAAYLYSSSWSYIVLCSCTFQDELWKKGVMPLAHLDLWITQPHRAPVGHPQRAASAFCHLTPWIISLPNALWHFVVSGWPMGLPGPWDSRDSRTGYSESLRFWSPYVGGIYAAVSGFSLELSGWPASTAPVLGNGVCRPKAGSIWELLPRRGVGNCTRGLGETLTWY